MLTAEQIDQKSRGKSFKVNAANVGNPRRAPCFRDDDGIIPAEFLPLAVAERRARRKSLNERDRAVFVRADRFRDAFGEMTEFSVVASVNEDFLPARKSFIFKFYLFRPKAPRKGRIASIS